jgi:Ribbon-helix-helix protein, copG family
MNGENLIHAREKANIQTAVYLRRDQVDELRVMADAEERPVSYLIRAAIDHLLRHGLPL